MNEIAKPLIDYLLDKIKNIEGSTQKKMLDELDVEAMQYFDAKELDLGEKKRKHLSEFVMPTLSQTIRWLMPIVIEVFAGDGEFLKVKPRRAVNIPAADYAEKLAYYQMRIKNKWFEFCWDWMHDAFLKKQGIAIYQWLEEKQKSVVVRKNVTAMQREGYLMNPDCKIIGENEIIVQAGSIIGEVIQPEIKNYDLVLEYTLKDEYPFVEAVPPNQCGYDYTITNIDHLNFFYRWFQLDELEIRERYGDSMFTRIEEQKERWSNKAEINGWDEVERQRFSDLGGTELCFDDKNKKYKIYEIFYRDRKTYRPMFAKICGKIFLEEPVINRYDRPPVRIITSFKLPHRIAGKSFYENVKNFQRLSTAIMRIILNNLYYNNEGRDVIDKNRINPDDYENSNSPGSPLLCDGNVEGAIQPKIPAMLQPWIFQLLEKSEQIIEYETGVPRSFKGVDIDTLNKTFRGQAQQINQASQVIRSIIRLIAEMGFIPLAKDFIKMDIKFLDKNLAFRIAEEFVELEPDNLIGEYDWIVNVGLGIDNKDQSIMRVQQLIGIYAQMFKAGVPVVTAKDAHNALKELVRLIGYKNVDDFTTDPKMVESVGQLAQAVMMHMQQMGSMIPQLMQPLQQVIKNFGLMQNTKNIGAPAANMERPKPPEVPKQPLTPTTVGDGNQFYG
jgi:hypothetical protein